MALMTASIVVPLYNYPLTIRTWRPLYEAIDSHPDVQFVVIINPNSGPGGPALDARYKEEIPRLNARRNVKTVGYVRTDYCRRDILEVLQEITIYASWSGISNSTGVYVQGIFLDETPNQYSEVTATYLDAVTTRVKSSDGVMGDRSVLHNPGTAPDSAIALLKPDITAVFEQSYTRYRSELVKQRLSAEKYDRASSCYIVHSVPTHETARLVGELVRRAGYLFVTDLQERYYESFGPGWSSFVSAVATTPVVQDTRDGLVEHDTAEADDAITVDAAVEVVESSLAEEPLTADLADVSDLPSVEWSSSHSGSRRSSADRAGLIQTSTDDSGGSGAPF